MNCSCYNNSQLLVLLLLFRRKKNIAMLPLPILKSEVVTRCRIQHKSIVNVKYHIHADIQIIAIDGTGFREYEAKRMHWMLKGSYDRYVQQLYERHVKISIDTKKSTIEDMQALAEVWQNPLMKKVAPIVRERLKQPLDNEFTLIENILGYLYANKQYVVIIRNINLRCDRRYRQNCALIDNNVIFHWFENIINYLNCHSNRGTTLVARERFIGQSNHRNVRFISVMAEAVGELRRKFNCRHPIEDKHSASLRTLELYTTLLRGELMLHTTRYAASGIKIGFIDATGLFFKSSKVMYPEWNVFGNYLQKLISYKIANDEYMQCAQSQHDFIYSITKQNDTSLVSAHCVKCFVDKQLEVHHVP